ncbi:MAG TPA: hydrogenase maturation protease [Bryobacteraceae bacterium]|nr:hydrogenase maturation protease [Bryobacteraceae bacterium]
MARRIAVIGLGNPDRGDDAAGILVVRSLMERPRAGVEFLEDGEPFSILGRWDDFEAMILVDAVRSGSPAGTVQVFDGRALPPSVRVGVFSTHGFGIHELIGVGAALHTLPRVVRVVGIEAADFTPGAPPTPEVERAVAEAVEIVVEEIERIPLS